jgi:hypothetical protein
VQCHLEAKKDREKKDKYMKYRRIDKLGKVGKMEQRYFIDSWLLPCSLRSHHIANPRPKMGFAIFRLCSPTTRYADIIAKQNITTSETVNVNNGNALNMRAGNSIILEPGFSVELGAEFSTTIENIYDCGTSSSPAPKIIAQNVPEENDNITDNLLKNKPNFSYSVYPNPTDEFINITYFLDTDMFLFIELANLFGQKIKTVLSKQNQQAGTYTLQIPVSEFSTGTYFLTISSTNQTKTEKIIINK